MIEETSQGLFRDYLAERPAKYLGQVLMYALQFKIADLSALVERGVEDMKLLESGLDSHIDNSGTYQILDFRRRYTGYGDQIISVKEIITRIDKGYFPMQRWTSAFWRSGTSSSRIPSSRTWIPIPPSSTTTSTATPAC